MCRAIRVVPIDEIPNHGQLATDVSGRPVLLFRHDREVYALDDICTHTGDSLGGGSVDEYTVTCPWHGAKFDIRTGKNLRLPAVCPTIAHRAHVEGDDVFVTLKE